MHTKKVKWIRNALLFLLLLGLTSCLEVKQSININKDGSGDAKMEIGIQQEWAAQIVPKLKSDIPKGWKLIEEKEKDGKHVLSIGRDFKTISELNDDEFRYFFSRERRGLFKNSYSLEITQLKSSEAPFPFETVVKMPGSVDETNGSKMASGEVKWNSQGLRRGNALFVKSSGFALPEFASLLTFFNGMFDYLFYREAITFYRNNDLWVMDSDGKNQKQLTHNGANSRDSLGSVCRDGSKIVYSKVVPYERGEGFYSDVFLLNPTNGEARKLTDDKRSRSPKISPECDQIVFEKAEWNDIYYGCCGKGLWLYDLNKGTQKELIRSAPLLPAIKSKFPWLNENSWFHDSEFIWSPDGKQLVFVRNYGKEWPYSYLVNLESPGTVIPIGQDLQGIVSDVGNQKVLFSSRKENYGGDLYEFDIRTGKHSLLQKDAKGGKLSPDEKRIVFEGSKVVIGVYYTSEDLWIMDTNGNNKKKLYSGSAAWPSWSPKGEKILFEQTSNNGQVPGIWIINADSSNLKKLADRAGFPNWLYVPRLSFISPIMAKEITLITIALMSFLLIIGVSILARKAAQKVAPKPKGALASGNIFCTQCGTPNPETASFCKKCGAKVG